MGKMSIKEIVKDNKVFFYFIRAGVAYYKVMFNKTWYMFPVRLDDLGDATLLAEDKAIFFMRYVRKAFENDEFVLATWYNQNEIN